MEVSMRSRSNQLTEEFMDINNLMKQAQKMQEDMQKAQSEIADMLVNGESGGGMVKVVMTGRHDVKNINIDPRKSFGETNAGGMKVRVLGDSSSDFKFKIKNKNK